MLNKTKKLYSPTINKYFKKLTRRKKDYLQECELNDRIDKLKTPTIMIGHHCEKVTTTRAKNVLKRNLYSTKLVDVKHIITPKQNNSNCWFNTFFMNFFISDRGRQFTKYFRYCMIEGKRLSKKEFSHSEKKVLAYLNLAIEACLTGNKIMYTFDTNKLILYFNKIIHKKYKETFTNIGESGNPIDCYENIINNIEGNKYSPFFVSLTYNHLSDNNVISWNVVSKTTPHTLYDIEENTLPKYWIQIVNSNTLFNYTNKEVLQWLHIFKYSISHSKFVSLYKEVKSKNIKGSDLKKIHENKYVSMNNYSKQLLSHEIDKLYTTKYKSLLRDKTNIYYNILSKNIKYTIEDILLPFPEEWASSFSGNNLPNLLILELNNELDFSHSVTVNKEYEHEYECGVHKPDTITLLTVDKKKIKYKLDSVIIRDTSNMHFCSVLTYDNKLYKFDGASFSTLQSFDWKHYLNKDKHCGFNGHNLRWNFNTCAQMLFYYRI